MPHLRGGAHVGKLGGSVPDLTCASPIQPAQGMLGVASRSACIQLGSSGCWRHLRVLIGSIQGGNIK